MINDVNLEFSEDEICRELAKLGYKNLPPDKIKEFKKDLQYLIEEDNSLKSEFSSIYNNHSHNNSSEILNKSHDIESFQSISSYKPIILKSCLKHNSDSNTNTTCHPKEIQKFTSKIISQPVNYDNYFKKQEDSNYSSVNRKTSDELNGYKQHPDNSKPLTSKAVTISECSSVCSSADSRYKVKRKVLRKVDGKVHVEESINEDDRFSIDELTSQESKENVPFKCNHISEDLQSHKMSSLSEKKNEIEPKSVILCKPMTKVKTLKNTHDPVARYHLYKQCWKNFIPPGEKSHKELRWNIREKMSYQDIVVTKNY